MTERGRARRSRAHTGGNSRGVSAAQPRSPRSPGRILLGATSLLLLCWGCGRAPGEGPAGPSTEPPQADAGARDTGPGDGGVGDAPGSGADATGGGDGPAAGWADRLLPPSDLPLADAGGPPPAADQPVVACTDSGDDVYVTPAGLPPMSEAARGELVRCASDGELSADQAAQALGEALQEAPEVTSATRVLRIAYRTYRSGQVPGVSSARVYLPRSPRGTPAPLVVVAHPSVGIADHCAPSRDPGSLQDLALPFAATGHVVVAPDFPGLGNEGVHAYLDNRDAGQALLDAVLAVRRLLAPGAIADGYLLLGFSQGGGAALSARALARSYGAAAGTLRATLAIAPEWPIRLNSFGYVDLLRNPDQLTFTSGLSRSAIAVLMQYGFFANSYGEGQGALAFPEAKREDLAGAVESLCLLELGGHLQVFARRLGDLIDDELRQGLLACIDGGPDAPGCQGRAREYHDRLQANVLAADAAAGPVLLVQGLADQILPPASEAACIVDKLVAEGVPTAVCTDTTATHSSVVERNMAHVLAWAGAVLDGQPPPACQGQALPVCRP